MNLAFRLFEPSRDQINYLSARLVDEPLPGQVTHIAGNYFLIIHEETDRPRAEELLRDLGLVFQYPQPLNDLGDLGEAPRLQRVSTLATSRLHDPDA